MKTLVRRGATGVIAGAVVTLGMTVPAHAELGTPVTPGSEGKVAAWGNPDVESQVPTGLDGKKVAAIEAGSYFSLALVSDGTVAAWGRDSADPVFLLPEGLDDVKALSAGAQNALALKDDGTVVAWGNSNTGVNTVPATLGPVKAIEMTPLMAMAVKADGTVATWGASAATLPVPDGLSDVASLASAPTHVLGLKSDGTVTAWGLMNIAGELDVPDEIQGHVTQIAAGMSTSAALTDDGVLHLWGSMAADPRPDALGDEEIAEVDISTTIVVRTESGRVFSWGGGANPDAASMNEVPASLEGQPIAAISAGTSHNLALVTGLNALTAPKVSGTAKVGQKLTLTPATFNETPDTVVSQWKANGTPISGATGSELTLTAAHVGKRITVTQTATKGDKTETTTSAATAPVAPLAVTSRLTANAPTVRYGVAPQVRVSLAPPTASGTVEVAAGSRRLAVGRLSAGRAVVTLPRTALAPGRHNLTVRYAGDATTKPSAVGVRLNISKAKATVAAKVRTKKVVAKRTKAKVKVSVRSNVRASGKVAVFVGKKKVGTARVKANGTAVVTLKKLPKAGKTKLKIRYLGSSTVDVATTTLRLKVRKR
ncbi:Ig-like domain repeat protein [Mumia quercus]|uniref:Ig-like domain repeat protein n=1 Tax=Mumia quercus TaxID=2976125 RepID=UPI0021D3C7EA|nr:Ig-like domain repeat protein [Mumia quercus]